MGRELSAQKTLATTILKIGDSCQVTSVLYDLKKATTELAASAEASCEEKALLGAVRDVAERLSRPLSEGAISTKTAKETLQVLARLDQLKKEKQKLEAEAKAAEEKRRTEEKKQKNLAAQVEQAKKDAKQAVLEAEEAKRAAEQAKREADTARAEAKDSKTYWEPFFDSIKFEIELRGCLWGNEFVGSEGGYWDSSAGIDHNDILLYRGSQSDPNLDDASIGGHKNTRQVGLGGRLGLRMMTHHTVFVIVDHLWQEWIGDTFGGQLLDESFQLAVLRVAGGYRFSYPVLSWLEPYAEAAFGGHIYLPTTEDRRNNQSAVELKPLDESPLSVMLGAGLRFSFLEYLYMSMGYLWDLPIGELTSSSWVLSAGATF